ncbi:MAG: hypothetical protein ACKO6J_05940, partial [Crocinitomicaceae bacterium]
LGNISFYDSQGRDMFTKPYSDDTAKVIDEEVSKLIEFQYTRALTILNQNQDKLTLLAERLLSNEVIFKEDLEEIFGKRQWEPVIQEEVEVDKEPNEKKDTEVSAPSDDIVIDSDFDSAESTDGASKEEDKPGQEE